MGSNSVSPWKKISERLVYKNPWVSLVEDEVINPDGSAGFYAVYNIRYAVGIIALDEDGNVHLVGQYRYGIGEFAWEIVEGGVDAGESSIDTAKRELRDELGFQAGDWVQLGPEVHISNCHTNERGAIFLAKNLKFVGASPEGTEILQTMKVDREKLKSMVDSGEIQDALSLIAIYRFLLE